MAAQCVLPDLLWGTATLLLMLLSEVPNIWLKRAAACRRRII